MSDQPVDKTRLPTLLKYSERVVYYGAALALLVTVGMLFVSAVTSMLAVFETGTLDTALTVLDRVLLIFIFVELLHTIGIFVRENEIVAEPFLLIGLIAVVRRILLVTAGGRTDRRLPGVFEPHHGAWRVDGDRDLPRRRSLLYPPYGTSEEDRRFQLTEPCALWIRD